MCNPAFQVNPDLGFYDKKENTLKNTFNFLQVTGYAFNP